VASAQVVIDSAIPGRQLGAYGIN